MGRTIFDIANQVLTTAAGYEALPFIPVQSKSNYEAKSLDQGDYAKKVRQSVNGAPLRKFKGGVYYFMPVSFKHEGDTWEFDDAIVSVTGKKSIVETPLIGRQGTVKELISINDYEIKLMTVISGEDYPEQDVMGLIKLFKINESIKIICAITDYFLENEDRVVIKSLDFPPMEGVEDMQAVVMTLLSDQNFELELS